MVLSQATSATTPSNTWPRATNSIESAIRSRLTSDASAPGAHSHAVADGYGVVFHRRPAGRADACFDVLCQPAQIVVARHGFDPSIRHADDGFLEVLVGEADGLQHGAARARGRVPGDGVAVQFHGESLW
jgi:hypothetical protein